MLAAVLRLALLLIALLPGCMPSDEPPDPTIPTDPAVCGNKICEGSLGENNVNCVQDCPNCYAIYVVRSETQEVLDDLCGAGTGKAATFAAGETVDITLGRDALLNQGQPKSIEIAGQVTGSAPADPTWPHCGADLVEGGVQVMVSPDGRSNFKLLTIWTQSAPNPAPFSLSCATQVPSTRYLRLYVLPGATLKLSAIHALSCYDQ
jgi:hypothetical protein